MNVFISWSGDQSKDVAEALHEWLPCVIQSVEPWLSSEDIPKGQRWSIEVGEKLEMCAFGLICVTQGNMNEPWLNFEAGALGKSMSIGYVSPYLLGMKPTDLKGPLTQFQATEATRDDTLRLVLDINAAMKDRGLAVARVRSAFDHWWEELSTKLEKAKTTRPIIKRTRSSEDMLQEVLQIVRTSSNMLAGLADRTGHDASLRPELTQHSWTPQQMAIQEKLRDALMNEILSGNQEGAKEIMELAQAFEESIWNDERILKESREKSRQDAVQLIVKLHERDARKRHSADGKEEGR